VSHDQRDGTVVLPSQPPPAPATAETAAELVEALNELRLWAGQPSLRTLRRLAGATTTHTGDRVDALPTSTTSHVLTGRGLPRPPRMEFVEAFVVACLRAAGRTEPEIAAEIVRWRDAWARVARGPRPAAAPGDTAAPRDAGAPGGTAPGAAAPTTAEPTRRTGRPTRWRWPFVALAVLLLPAAGAVGARTWPWGEPGPAATPTTAPRPAAVYREDIVEGLRDVDGIDLDTGTVGGQNAPGTDLSPWGRANHVVTRTSAMVLLLPEAGPVAYERCAAAPVGDRVMQISGLHGLAAGRNLCVWTTEGRVAMLTLTRTPEARSGTLAFRSVVWPARTPR